jgi:prevent-host-death family protein
MRISVTDAEQQLDELVSLAEAGDEVILTRHGLPAVLLTPIKTIPDRATRRAILEKLRRAGEAKGLSGEDAARSQDFLYDEYGLPK